MTESKKKMGRPIVPENEYKQVVSIRLSAEEKAQYEKEAEKQGISMSEFTRKALQFFNKSGNILK